MVQSLRRRSFLILAVAAGVAVVSSASHASHSWGNYHWARQSNPFTLKLGDNVHSKWDAYLAEASQDWTASSVLNTTIVAGNAKGNCRPTSGRVEVCAKAYGQNGWLGLAQIWVSGSHITQATAKMNDTYFDTATYNTPAWRRMVMCQEVAHDFGLDHQDETFDNANLGSCMDYTNDPDGGSGGASNNDPSNEHPNAHDFDQLETIYAHLDNTTTVGMPTSRQPPAMSHIDFDSPGQWGRLVSSRAGGRVQIYELDFGHGNRVLTRVTWADPERDREH